MAGLNSNFQLAPGESFVQCPYNLAHHITNARILGHLVKCRNNYIKETEKKGEKLQIVPCRFNFAHQCPKIEIDFHETTCPDQHKIVGHLVYHQSEEFQAKAAAQFASNYESSANAEAANDWDEDAAEDWEKETKGYGPGYDPNVRLQQGPVIPRVPQGMTKSERKAFREQERLRQEEYLKKENESMSCKKEDHGGYDDFGAEDPYA